MRERRWREFELTTITPEGTRSTVRGEYDADGESPKDAAYEIVKAVANLYGSQRVRNVKSEGA